MTDERQKIERALIHWRENQMDEWCIEYYFDCGPLGIVRLFVLRYHNTWYWQCRWLDVEPCPVSVDAPEGLPTVTGEWVRPMGGVEYEV